MQQGAHHRVRQRAELKVVMRQPRVRRWLAGMESKAHAWALLKITSGL